MKFNENTNFKMPFWRLILSPFGYLVDFFKNIMLLFLAYSVVASVLSFIFGFGFLCSSPAASGSGMYCNGYGWQFVVYSVLKLLLVACFVINYYDILSKKFAPKDMLKFTSRSMRVSLMLVVLVLINTVPAVSGYFLKIRVPNPNWQIESIYFTIVAIGFLVPFALARLYAGFGYYIEDNYIISPKVLWQKTSGNTWKILTGLFLILFFAMFFLVGFYINFLTFNPDNMLYSSIVSEFVYNVISFLIIGLFVGHFYTQREILID